MIHKTVVSGCNMVRVTFELPSCIWADRIFVTGDFNEWTRSATPMRQGRDGVWRATVELASGQRYQFRYLIDGQWQTDWHADGSVVNSYGSENSLVDTSIVSLRSPDVMQGALVHEAQAQAAVPQRLVLQAA